MAVKTFTLTASNDVSVAALADGVDQTAATRSTEKWTVAKVAAGNSANFFAGGGIQGSGTFDLNSTTPKPPATFSPGMSARIPAALTGTFAATAWTCTFAVRATTASAQAGRVRMRVWKDTDNLGIAAIEVTSAAQVGTTSAALSTTADVTSVVTWSPGVVALTSEYLFFTLAWEITTASGSNNGDVAFRTGQAAGGTRIVTPDLGTGVAPIATRPVIVGQAVGRGALV